jgi:hypothetical protein
MDNCEDEHGIQDQPNRKLNLIKTFFHDMKKTIGKKTAQRHVH